jgi:hypothetical protein
MVVIQNRETGAERKLLSDENGRYFAPSISVGNYRVSVAKTGFTSQLKTGIDLVVGQSSTVDFVLPVGDLKQTITVEEAAAPVNLSTQQPRGSLASVRCANCRLTAAVTTSS